MLQAYSSNISVAANTACPLNNKIVDKGCAESLSGVSTINLNNAGVYMIECDGYCTPSAAGPVTFQLNVDGIPQAQAITSFTGVADTVDTFGFKTLVQCRNNNTNCCCTSPVSLQIINGETAVDDLHINVCVTKLC